MRRALFFLLALFLFAGVGWSQKKTITVTGVIISSADKEPVIAASVSCVEFPHHRDSDRRQRTLHAEATRCS